MSPKDAERGGEKEGAGFSPAKPKPSKISIPEVGELRKIFEDSKLAKWVVLAGVGGLVELIRAVVDIIRVIKSF